MLPERSYPSLDALREAFGPICEENAKRLPVDYDRYELIRWGLLPTNGWVRVSRSGKVTIELSPE